ncbi:MAG: flavodoxin family protein [Firmicutes bacterium]|nr:flavodoxin family protein [Bacillota bacterium]
MKILVVYDSYFGNTRQVAQVISEALSPYGSVRMCQVCDETSKKLDKVELLIVGSPTRAFRATKAINAFLDKIPIGGLKGVKTLAFDTRLSAVETDSGLLNALSAVFGCAAAPIAEKLKRKGGELLAPPEGFFVKESEGPLKSEELERAVNWVQKAVGSFYSSTVIHGADETTGSAPLAH